MLHKIALENRTKVHKKSTKTFIILAFSSEFCPPATHRIFRLRASYYSNDSKDIGVIIAAVYSFHFITRSQGLRECEHGAGH